MTSNFGATVYFPTSDIAQIFTDGKYNIFFKSGESIRGKLVRSSEGNTVLVSDSFGSINIVPNTIVKMTPHIEKVKEPASNNPTTEDKNKHVEYGQSVDEQPPLDFLTGSTVLLKPKNVELDFELNYKHNRNAYKLGYWERSSYSVKQVEAAIGIRAGLWEGSEGFFRVPYTYTKINEVSTNTWVRSKDSGDFGDISFGLQQTLIKESDFSPAITASLAVTAPTGRKEYRQIADTWERRTGQ